MPYGGPTRSTLVVGRLLNTTSYSLSLLVSLGDILAPSEGLLVVSPQPWSVILSGILLVLSVLGLAAVATRRWRIEWVTATAIAFLLLARSVPMWERLFTGFPESTSIAAMTALGAICLAQRALSLRVFFLRTLQIAENPSDAR